MDGYFITSYKAVSWELLCMCMPDGINLVFTRCGTMADTIYFAPSLTGQAAGRVLPAKWCKWIGGLDPTLAFEAPV